MIYCKKNCYKKKTLLNLNYQMNNWWRELKINYFVLYQGKQKVNERKIMKCRENSETFYHLTEN